MSPLEHDRPKLPTCGYCRFFNEHSGAVGDCHRYPPQYAGNDTPNERHRWKHPLVPHNGWCGEFLLR